MKNPGKIIKLADGRIVVMHHKQDLLKTENKVILYLLDENMNPLMDDQTKKQRTLLVDRTAFGHTMKGSKIMGMVD